MSVYSSSPGHSPPLPTLRHESVPFDGHYLAPKRVFSSLEATWLSTMRNFHRGVSARPHAKSKRRKQQKESSVSILPTGTPPPNFLRSTLYNGTYESPATSTRASAITAYPNNNNNLKIPVAFSLTLPGIWSLTAFPPPPSSIPVRGLRGEWQIHDVDIPRSVRFI